jgi:diacylglycerol O-acyltransferase
MWIAEGLAEGRFAAIARVHHAFADGVSFARILASWFAPDERAAIVEPPHRPGQVEQVTRSVSAGAKELVRDTAAYVAAARRRERAAPANVGPSPYSGRRIGPRRSFGCQALAMADVQRARKPLGATVNDLLLALVSGAIADQLRAGGVSSPRPLVAVMPVSLLTPGEHAPIGNRGLTTVQVVLPTDVADPAKRVSAACSASARAKQELAATTGARFDDAICLLPRRLTRLLPWILESGRVPPLGNVSVSNVRGPGARLAADGVTVEDFFSVGPLPPAVGLNITAWSYASHFNVSLLADADIVPDPSTILGRLPNALAQLVAHAGSLASADNGNLTRAPSSA